MTEPNAMSDDEEERLFEEWSDKIMAAQDEWVQMRFGHEPYSWRVQVTGEHSLGAKVFSGPEPMRYRGFLTTHLHPETGAITHHFDDQGVDARYAIEEAIWKQRLGVK